MVDRSAEYHSATTGAMPHNDPRLPGFGVARSGEVDSKKRKPISARCSVPVPTRTSTAPHVKPSTTQRSGTFRFSRKSPLCPFPLPVTLPPSLHPSPVFTIVNGRLKSVPPPSAEPSQCPRPNTELPNAAPPILSPAHQNHQYHPQTTPILPHSPPSHAQRPTQMNRNERK